MIRPVRRTADVRVSPVWLITFSDLVCLLLSFFVLILSFSRIDPTDFSKAARSVRGALGASGATVAMGRFSAPAAVRPPAENAARAIRRRLQILGADNSIGVAYDPEGNLRLTLPSAVLFEGQESDLNPQAFPVLREIAAVLTQHPRATIEVRGHTDSTPLNPTPAAPDNYALSHLRAHAVAQRLHEEASIPMSRFELIARGPDEPRATQATPEGREANGRVEIHVRGFNESQASAAP
jgi:chemotaxis protein MotB